MSPATEAVVLDAVRSGSVDELLEIFDGLKSRQDGQLKSVVNYSEPQTGHTALHLACNSVSADLVTLLLEHGADPNSHDKTGATAVLHVMQHLKDMCRCEPCTRGAVKCVNALGQAGADMNHCNKIGSSPLYMAAWLGLEPCATALLNHGAKLPTTSSDGSILALLLERTPEVVLTIFDQAITPSGVPHGSGQLPNANDKNLELFFDMSVIVPSNTTEANDQQQNIDSGQQEAEVKSSAAPKIRRPRPRREMQFLCELLDTSSLTHSHSAYNKILQHPIVHVLADLKWNRLKLLYFVYMAMQINYLVWYTIFLFLAIYIDCKLKHVVSGSRSVMNSTTDQLVTYQGPLGLAVQILDPFSGSCHIQLVTKLVAGYVMVCAMGSALKEGMHCVMDFRNYAADLVNYIQILGIGTTMATVVIVLAPSLLAEHARLLTVWLYPLASFGIGICWLQLFLIIGRLPEFAMYLEMLSRITYNFCVTLAMYSFILVAFAMSYCMLFPGTEPADLSDFPIAFLRIMTALVGELNFETLIEDTKEGRVISPWLGLIWYATLLVGVAMVLMNLLVGLAVSDIQGCKQNAEVVVIKRRLWYLVYLEKSFFLGTLFVPSCLRDLLRKRVAVVTPEGNKFGNQVIIRPNDTGCGPNLTSLTRTAIKQWLKRVGPAQAAHRAPEVPNGVPDSKTSEPGPEIKADTKIDTDAGHRRIRYVEYRLQKLESQLSDLDLKLDRYFQQMMFTKANNEYE